MGDRSLHKRVLLVVGGGIAAYKSLLLIRRLQDAGVDVRCVLTRAAEEFVTALSVGALSGDKVYRDLFDLTDEAEMGHIELSRSADLIVVAPATADLMAKMACGMANDLASTVLLATDTDVLIAPAMNVRMWSHPATQDNLAKLISRGVEVIGPDEGGMACGEFGPGRMSEPEAICAAILARLKPVPQDLVGRKIVVTSGPTHEPIDPVRYIANRSSGKQGTAIAAALLARGAEVVLVTGPASAPPPSGEKLQLVQISTASQMLDAARAALPANAVICAAAVADYRVANAAEQKIKKDQSGPPTLELVENPDILATISALPNGQRPGLVIGFAAETEKVVEHASAKRMRKGCDWICANDVSQEQGVFGGNDNHIHLITDDGVEEWPRMSKAEVATRLAARIARSLA